MASLQDFDQIPEGNMFRRPRQDDEMAVIPKDARAVRWDFPTAYEIERDRLAAKGHPMPVRDGTQGE